MDARIFWNNLDAQLELLDMTFEKLCRKASLDISLLRSKKVANRWPAVDETYKISCALGIEVEVLLSEKNEDIFFQEDQNVFMVPFLEQELSAGFGQILPEDDSTKKFIEVPQDLRKYGNNLAALKVSGDSMYPTLNSGDIVVCDSSGYEGEGLYAIRYHGNGFIKRIAMNSREYKIISDNKNYHELTEPLQSDDISIIGKVRYIKHDVKSKD